MAELMSILPYCFPLIYWKNIVKLHSELKFVFPPSQQLRTINNPKQNLPEGSVLQAWNVAHRLNSQKKHQVKTALDGDLPYLGWSPTNQSMVSNPKEVQYRHGIWYLNLTHKTNTRWQLPTMDGHLPSLELSPTNQRMVDHQKEVQYRLGIWYVN